MPLLSQGPDFQGVEVWRGGVNTWECDEMGHMNVRFYVTRVQEGLVGLAAELGLPHAYSPEANATLLIREQHIRFLREAHATAPLHMLAGVVEMGETDARLLLVLHHSVSGEPAASFQVVVDHVTPRHGRPFPWPRAVRERAAGLMVEIPSYAAARSLSLDPVQSACDGGRAKAMGLMRIAAGAIGPQDCDVFGRMRADQFIGRVSDGISVLASRSRNAVVEGAETQPRRVGGAVLEYRLIHLDWPRAGDRVEISSGLAGVDHRTQRMVHWMYDPATGKPWGTSAAVAITMDLDARKIIPVSEAAQAALRRHQIEGLTL